MSLFTAPAFFPRELLHPVLRSIAAYNPLAYVVEGMRGALHASSTLGNPLHGLLAAIGLAVVATALAVFAIYERGRTQ